MYKVQDDDSALFETTLLIQLNVYVNIFLTCLKKKQHLHDFSKGEGVGFGPIQLIYKITEVPVPSQTSYN